MHVKQVYMAPAMTKIWHGKNVDSIMLLRRTID